MRTFSLILLILVLPLFTSMAQERIDVVYLNNGDIRRGIITENVPNEYIRIEMSDGSIYTIRYSDIKKITKEPRQDATPASSTLKSKSPFASRTSDFGVTAALWLAGDIHLDDFGVSLNKNAGLLLRVYYDGYLVPQLAMGVYFNFAPVSWEGGVKFGDNA